MLPLQRKQMLLNYLAQNGAATMKELSDRFGVSEMTVRRDLRALEEENRVRRSHGERSTKAPCSRPEEPGTLPSSR